ncbi:DAK2 domain-containing protein [Paenibacillus mesophilus]|uniref:DAK2 domain-containing protein n=1 Tax=Paenibacillus mesophilus TaxID=2582849 RepID=UPI00192E5711|nr:DAK2 domain-containing protein [Paenibacillus mesophilus]
MISRGAEALHANVGNVNALNVFPVPDGDTGTNMNMTLTSGVEELKKKTSPHIGKSAEALSKGLLMGARGNSGVILSQLFRGFAKAVQDQEEIDVQQFAAALQQGVDTAYKAILKPVEGTILTVAREAAKHGLASVRRSGDIGELMREVLAKAKEALAKTPEQLPVLKQVGVVDAGGQGLVLIYEGFVAALSGEMPDVSASDTAIAVNVPGHGAGERMHAQAHLATEDIEFGYCTEFMIRLEPGKTPGAVFDEPLFRDEMERHGDSVLVVADDDLVKVHLHSEYPGNVLTFAQRYGELVKIKIDNMREQHTHIVEESGGQAAKPLHVHDASKQEDPVTAESAKPFGFVAVSAGDGIAAIFKNMGVDVVLSGGQTMNPSTEDIVGAIDKVRAETVFVLPNNSNIVLAAQQARDLTDRRIIVLPTKTIPQGISAMLAFQANATAERNAAAMEEAIGTVQSGQVTYAVRDSQIDGIDIREGDYLGIHNSKIVVSGPDLLDTCRKLLDSMMAEGGEVVTVLTGAEASESDTVRLAELVEEAYPDAELEVLAGGQPLYYYLFSVE